MVLHGEGLACAVDSLRAYWCFAEPVLVIASSAECFTFARLHVPPPRQARLVITSSAERFTFARLTM
jgi:hypothetical protein